jgi:hypothetical protein
MEEMGVELGCDVMGLAAHVDTVVGFVSKAKIDVAVLDLQWADKEVYPVAEDLAEQHIPHHASVKRVESGLNGLYPNFTEGGIRNYRLN